MPFACTISYRFLSATFRLSVANCNSTRVGVVIILVVVVVVRIFHNGITSERSELSTAEPAYSYIAYSRFLAVVELNLIPFAFIIVLFYSCYSRLLL